jgi:hypothetical protein
MRQGNMLLSGPPPNHYHLVHGAGPDRGAGAAERFGAGASAVVEAYQSSRGRPVNGVVDAATSQYLVV